MSSDASIGSTPPTPHHEQPDTLSDQTPAIEPGTDYGLVDDPYNYLEEFEPLPPDSDYARGLQDVQFRSYFLDPEGTAAIREVDGLDPIDEAAFNEWVAALDPSQLRELVEIKQAAETEKAAKVQVHNKLMSTVPELYSARLPEHLAARLADTPYALGFNQSAASSIAEAQSYLLENGGVDVTDYNYDQRFMIYDQAMDLDGAYRHSITTTVDSGYTGMSSIGRFVVAFPAVNARPDQLTGLSAAINLEVDILPDDFSVSPPGNDGETRHAVNSKYVAGFIDADGTFWENVNFVRLNEPAFARIKA